MKGLKTVLISIYAFLVLLLLLGFIRCCNREEPAAAAADRASNIGHDGRLKITLLWDFPGDIDLHVIEPNRREICFYNAVDRSTGGFLDVDNTAGGVGSAENIYWETPPSGNYSVSLVYYSASSSCPYGGPCTVVVKREVNGSFVTETFNVRMTVVNSEARVPVTSFTVE